MRVKDESWPNDRAGTHVNSLRRVLEPNMEEVEEIEIAVPWGRIAAKCWHSCSSKPVLVAHGLNENAGSFDRLIPLLPRDFYYVAVDLPGHGFSSPFPHGLPLDFMNYVHQLQWIVRHFRWEKFILMGHSFGGHIAEFYAATFTKKVEKLILLEAWSPTPVAKEIFLVVYRNQMREILRGRADQPKSYTYAEALSTMMNGRWSKLNSRAAVALLNRCLTKTEEGYVFNSDFRTRWEVKPPLDEDTLFDVFGRIKCPVLVVLGAESELTSLYHSPGYYSRVLHVLKNSHPSSRVARVGGNHCLHNNDPEAVAPIIASFLFDTKSNL